MAWLQDVFHDHYVQLKVPVVRFLYPRVASEGAQSHELIKGVYCTFTIVRRGGQVVGCIDVPGLGGLKASSRDLKQKLLAECGLAYAVVLANELPPEDVLRAAFLMDPEGTIDFEGLSIAPSELPQVAVLKANVKAAPGPAPSEVEVEDTVRDNLRGADGTALQPDDAVSAALAGGSMGAAAAQVDISAVAAVKSSLRAKLESKRKTRDHNLALLSARLGIVEDNADRNFVAQWDDSFIMADEDRAPKRPAA